MFEIFTFPKKVTDQLSTMGWADDLLPSPSKEWVSLIQALRRSGLSPNQTASLLDRALQGEISALEEVDRQAGLYGLRFFGTRDDWMENPEAFLKKRE